MGIHALFVAVIPITIGTIIWKGKGINQNGFNLKVIIVLYP